jgi:Transcriptional regulator, effector-binding domain/component
MYFRAPPYKYKKRPGLYVISYSRGDFFNHGGLYHTLVEFIDANGLEIAGNAYEDYILDSILVSDPEEYLMRLSIEVRKKKKPPLRKKRRSNTSQ